MKKFILIILVLLTGCVSDMDPQNLRITAHQSYTDYIEINERIIFKISDDWQTDFYFRKEDVTISNGWIKLRTFNGVDYKLTIETNFGDIGGKGHFYDRGFINKNIKASYPGVTKIRIILTQYSEYSKTYSNWILL